MKDIV